MRTRLNPAMLARRQTPPRLDERLALRRLRIALMAVIIARRPEPTHAWDDVARTDPRAALPCEKERAMVHAAIHQGLTTPERVIDYRLFQMADDLAQFDEAPQLAELLYVRLIQDEAEALDAQSIDHALPSPTHHVAAIAATQQLVRDARVFLELAR